LQARRFKYLCEGEKELRLLATNLQPAKGKQESEMFGKIYWTRFGTKYQGLTVMSISVLAFLSPENEFPFTLKKME
jgi:hypothetical protein